MTEWQGNELSLWYLGDPSRPVPIGRVRLDATKRHCILDLGPDWQKTGFELSPDLPLATVTHHPKGEMAAPGALDDAMPDRWGERMIRVISRPRRMTPLDKLYYAGDRRFGALGISANMDDYVPFADPPLVSTDSLQEAQAVIARVLEREPLDERERQLIASANSMGGAHPKMLVQHDGEEWIAKFPRGSNVDQLLVEHASMELARRAGIQVADSMAVLGDVDHILMVRRFDRDGARRLHAISARTILIGEGDDSYATIAGAIRRHARPDEFLGMQQELFRRMAFNIMIDNTDDHTKNHSFLWDTEGHWGLSPAYDIPVQMNGLGIQAIQVSSDPRFYNRFDAEHAMAAARHFGMDKEVARQEWNEVAGWVNCWRSVFAECGVSTTDIDYLSDFLESDQLRSHRADAVSPAAPCPGSRGGG